MEEITNWPATKLIEAMKQRQLSAVEVMQAHLAKLEKINPLLKGLVQQFSEEELLQKAKDADLKIEKGEPLGKLHGLPVTIKDFHLVKGLNSCAGCTGFMGHVAHEDSTLVARLKKEGAIVVGLTNVPEFWASYETDNLVYGRTNNPYDLNRSSGGSSGGCAALIAASCIPLSLGSDGGGSIRWPAHCTGIAGHKPTIGLLPRTGSVVGNAKGLIAQFVTSGPMARYVEDLILTLPILAGPDGMDPHAPPVSLHDHTSLETHSLRVAYLIQDGISDIANDIVSALENTVKELKPHVSKLELIDIPFLKSANRLLGEFFSSDRGEEIKNILAKLHVDKISPLLQQALQNSEKNTLTVVQFRQLFREIDLFRMGMLQTLKDYDILISPVASTIAKKHGRASEESKDMSHCMVHSLTGWPVTVVRIGTSREGLPIGVQIAAKPWKDLTCLNLGKKVESLLGGWQPPKL